MKFPCCFLLFVTLFLSAVTAISDEFSLKLSGPKQLNGMLIYEEDDSLYIGKPSSDDLLGGKIQDDGTLKFGDDKFVGIKKNYLTVTNNYTDYTMPFGIDKDGYLTLYSEKKFKAIPSGQTDVWILASDNTISSLNSVYSINIKCVDSTGKKLNKFSVSGSSASKLFNKNGMITDLFILLSFYVFL